jgi:hypothetical protein
MTDEPLTPYVLHLMECRYLAAARGDWEQFDEYAREIREAIDRSHDDEKGGDADANG